MIEVYAETADRSRRGIAGPKDRAASVHRAANHIAFTDNGLTARRSGLPPYRRALAPFVAVTVLNAKVGYRGEQRS